jgi:hypothetical protein
MVKLIRTEISYGALRKECLEALRHWPGDHRRDSGDPRNTVAGFSVKITLYGKADKRIADRALTYVEREKRRRFRLIA